MTGQPLVQDAWSTRDAVAFAEHYDGTESGATQISVTVSTPGTYVTKELACRVKVEMRGGPGKKRLQIYAHQDIDVFVGDLDRLIAALTEAVRVARAEGVLEKYGEVA